jgi:hypothetical protein
MARLIVGAAQFERNMAFNMLLMFMFSCVFLYKGGTRMMFGIKVMVGKKTF